MSDETRLEYAVYLKKCYKVTDVALLKLAKITKEKVKSDLSLSITLSDSQSLTSKSMETLISDSIIEISTIKSISIASYAFRDPDDRRIVMNIENSNMLGPIRLSISGSKDFVNSARPDVLNIIGSCRAWYWPFNYTGSFPVFIAYVLLFAVFSLFYTAWVVSHIDADWATRYPNAMGALVAACFFSGIVCAFSIRNYIFPPLVIRLGKNKRAADLRSQITKFIFGTVLVGTLVSLFSNQIWDMIKAYVEKSK